jgi:hypothetical protein
MVILGSNIHLVFQEAPDSAPGLLGTPHPGTGGSLLSQAPVSGTFTHSQKLSEKLTLMCLNDNVCRETLASDVWPLNTLKLALTLYVAPNTAWRLCTECRVVNVITNPRNYA